MFPLWGKGGLKPIKMKKLFSVSVFLLFSMGFSQVKISGKITAGNKAIKDVNITLKDTYDGATSDADGNYSFETSETGHHILIFSHANYFEIEKPVVIENQPVILNIEMKAQFREIDAVAITAGAMEASDKKRSAAALTPIDIYTTAGSEGQTTTGYKFLPGVQNAGESEGLFVRGGTGSETKFFIDGNLVNNYFSNSIPGLAGRERFNTSIFKGSVFSSGGYSALFGQALSSVLLLESVDIPEQSSYSFGIFPFSLGGDYQSLNKNKNASFGVGTNFSDLSLMTKVLKLFDTDFIQAPRSYSVNGNFRIKTKSGGFLKYYGSFDANNLGVSQQSLEPDYTEEQPSVKGNNTFHSLNFKQKFGAYILNLGSSFSVNKNHLEIGILNDGNKIGNVNINTQGIYFNNKAVIERKIAAASNIKAGFELLSENDKTEFSSFFSPQNTAKIRNFTTALFAENNLAFDRNFSASIGLRAENSSFLDKWNLAPRFSAAYKLSEKWVTSLAYGIFYQTPESQYLTPNFAQNFQKATHYILQFQRNENGRTFRVEGFYKDYEHLIKTSVFGYQSVTQNAFGNGYAKGIEFFWRDKKSIQDVDYWISYSYLDSKREYLNYPSLLYPNFAAKHNFSIVAKKFVVKWKTGFNFSYTYTSGRPFYDIVANAGQNQLLQSGKVKDYNSLNFAVNYLPNIGKKDAKSFTIFVAGISNILGTNNIYGYRFSTDGLRNAPILPAAKTFVYIGALFSFGIDKTQEAVDEHL
jgi:hypothetical protein